MAHCPINKCLTGVFLVASLALFFGLFFGLNYPEVVRHGWPLTRCTVLSADIASRYCCETSCATGSCRDAPSGSPQCSPLISYIDNEYSPTECASNSTSCPPQIGSVCDGGSYCCSECCSTCTSCSSSCSGYPTMSCTQSCSSYSCNCSCCSSTSHLYCVLSCPVCYSVNLQLLYPSRDGVWHNVSYVQDFAKDVNKTEEFFNQHLTNSTSFCYYNPANEAKVVFNVSFTTWKWVITAIFGILPLFITLGLFTYFLLVLPLWSWACAGLKAGLKDMTYVTRTKAFLARLSPNRTPNSSVLETPAPSYKEKEEGKQER